MIRFFISFAVLVFAVVVAVFIGASEGVFMAPSFFSPTLLLLGISTAGIFVFLYRAATTESFLRLYLLTMVIKLAAYCLYNWFMIVKDPAGATINVLFFMVTYFVFTLLEIGFLYRKIRAGNGA